MEQQLHTSQLLEQFLTPAFWVRDGKILQVNYAAKCRLIQPDTQIESLLGEHMGVYRQFSGGSLYLPLDLGGCVLGFTVTREQTMDLFVADSEASPALQAMGLASRELRAPMADITTASERLLALLEEHGGAQDAARINRSLHQMHRLLCNMSDAAAYEADTGLRHSYVDMAAVLAEAFEKAAALTCEAGIALNYQGLTEPVYSLADPEKLQRCVYNLISNALKFTPSGGAVNATLTKHGNRLQLTVSDSGSGIPAQLRGTVFSRYQREAGIEDGRYGIGLGMVLIRATALAHGGTVLVEQPENCGARITVTFAIRKGSTGRLSTPILTVDYASGRDHALQELSDVLPCGLYE